MFMIIYIGLNIFVMNMDIDENEVETWVISETPYFRVRKSYFTSILMLN